MVIFITGQLDTPSDPLKKAAKKVHDSGGKIVAYKLNDIVSDDVLVKVIPKDQIIKVDGKHDPWRLAMLFDFQTRKGEKAFYFLFKLDSYCSTDYCITPGSVCTKDG